MKLRTYKSPDIKKEWPEFNNHGKPICIEIGCGVGLHPILYSKKYPENFLVAIEHTKNKFEKFERRFQNNGSPSNLLPIHGNAINWINDNLTSHSVYEYFLLYPNPSPKAGDLNKRWYAMPFMGVIIDTLVKGGRITIASNETFYIEEAKNYMTKNWNLKLLNESKILEQETYRTHFEKKYVGRKEDCINLVFQKI